MGCRGGDGDEEQWDCAIFFEEVPRRIRPIQRLFPMPLTNHTNRKEASDDDHFWLGLPNPKMESGRSRLNRSWLTEPANSQVSAALYTMRPLAAAPFRAEHVIPRTLGRLLCVSVAGLRWGSGVPAAAQTPRRAAAISTAKNSKSISTPRNSKSNSKLEFKASRDVKFPFPEFLVGRLPPAKNIDFGRRTVESLPENKQRTVSIDELEKAVRAKDRKAAADALYRLADARQLPSIPTNLLSEFLASIPENSESWSFKPVSIAFHELVNVRGVKLSEQILATGLRVFAPIRQDAARGCLALLHESNYPLNAWRAAHAASAYLKHPDPGKVDAALAAKILSYAVDQLGKKDVWALPLPPWASLIAQSNLVDGLKRHAKVLKLYGLDPDPISTPGAQQKVVNEFKTGSALLDSSLARVLARYGKTEDIRTLLGRWRPVGDPRHLSSLRGSLLLSMAQSEPNDALQLAEEFITRSEILPVDLVPVLQHLTSSHPDKVTRLASRALDSSSSNAPAEFTPLLTFLAGRVRTLPLIRALLSTLGSKNLPVPRAIRIAHASALLNSGYDLRKFVESRPSPAVRQAWVCYLFASLHVDKNMRHLPRLWEAVFEGLRARDPAFGDAAEGVEKTVAIALNERGANGSLEEALRGNWGTYVFEDKKNGVQWAQKIVGELEKVA